MENEKNKFKITKIEDDKKRFKIKKIEYYKELDEVNRKINEDLQLIGMIAMAITMFSIVAFLSFNSSGLTWELVVQIALLAMYFGATFPAIVDLTDQIPQKTTLKAKIEGLNDLLNAEEPKKLVLSKNEQNREFRKR